MKMLKNVFVANSPRGKSYSIRTLLGTMSAGSMPELEAKHKELTDKITIILGRPPTEHEMRFGVPKPEPTKEQISEARKLKAREAYAERIEDEAAHNPAADRLQTAQRAAEQERRGKLTHAERELEDATREAQAEKQRRDDAAKKQEIKASAAYQTLRSGLDDAMLIARLDPSITQAQLDALLSQSEQLEKTMDLSVVRANLTVIQKAISGEIELRDADLKAAVDRAELRRRMLASGSTFDSVDVELVGDLAFVCLSVNGVTKKVSQFAYDSRTSDEALKTQLFGESEATNV